MIISKCSEAVVGLEILDGLSTGLRCSLKRSESSFGFTYVLFAAVVVALYHVNDVFGVTVNVISDRSGFARSMEYE